MQLLRDSIISNLSIVRRPPPSTLPMKNSIFAFLWASISILMLLKCHRKELYGAWRQVYWRYLEDAKRKSKSINCQHPDESLCIARMCAIGRSRICIIFAPPPNPSPLWRFVLFACRSHITPPPKHARDVFFPPYFSTSLKLIAKMCFRCDASSLALFEQRTWMLRKARQERMSRQCVIVNQ